MRDILEDLVSADPLDPTEAARRNMRPQLRKRFYATVDVAEEGGAFAVRLDGRPIHTPARRLLAAPTRPLAQAIAAEWDAQTDVVDPAHMPLTRLANSIIDGVADKPDEVRAEVAKYLTSDLLFYRADGPQGLIERQQQHWDPVLGWAREALDARFMLSEGVMFVGQGEGALANAAAAIPADAWRLGAVQAITTLTGSALLALAVAHGRLEADTAWAAAHVDEDWQMEHWGRDDLALQRLAFRWAEMQAAARVLAAYRAP
jgi:chaperone required for assembly of F1-ATPase